MGKTFHSDPQTAAPPSPHAQCTSTAKQIIQQTPLWNIPQSPASTPPSQSLAEGVLFVMCCAFANTSCRPVVTGNSQHLPTPEPSAGMRWSLEGMRIIWQADNCSGRRAITWSGMPSPGRHRMTQCQCQVASSQHEMSPRACVVSLSQYKISLTRQLSVNRRQLLVNRRQLACNRRRLAVKTTAAGDLPAPAQGAGGRGGKWEGGAHRTRLMGLRPALELKHTTYRKRMSMRCP